MKKLFLLLLASIFSLTSFAKVEMDTIYYDQNWKGVSSPNFANYYRVIEKNPLEGYQKNIEITTLQVNFRVREVMFRSIGLTILTL